MNLIWFRTAKENLCTAKSNLDNGFFPTSYREATYCSENALKAIICPEDSTDLPRSLRTHDQSELLRHIEINKLLPTSVLEVLDSLYDQEDNESMRVINLTSESGDHTDCFTDQIPHTRYPRGNSTPAEMIGEFAARQRVKKAEEIVKALSQYFKT